MPVLQRRFVMELPKNTIKINGAVETAVKGDFRNWQFCLQ